MEITNTQEDGRFYNRLLYGNKCYTKVGLPLHRTHAYRSGNNTAFSHDVTTATLLSQTNPLGVEIFSFVKALVLFQQICIDAGHVRSVDYDNNYKASDANVPPL